jgi:glycosyltransferase involved in cell wall biosynthesis
MANLIPSGKSSILVLITTYQCEAQVGRVLAQLDDQTAPWVVEVAVIDNRSSDATAQNAQKAIKELAPLAKKHGVTLTMLINTDNFNLGGSHKAGFAYALDKGYQHVVVLHGDDQGDLHDLLPALEEGMHLVHDCVLGGRFMQGSKLGAGYGWFRRFGNYVFLILFTLFCNRITWDMGSGLNLYSRKVIEAGDHIFAADNLTFHCYFLLNMFARGRDIIYVPITWREEDQVSNAKLFRQSWEILRILLSYRFRKQKFLSGEFGSHAICAYKTEIVVQITD